MTTWTPIYVHGLPFFRPESTPTPEETTVTDTPASTEARPGDLRPDAVALARQFHETYERLAPELGYETRADSAVPWDEVPYRNRWLMSAVAAEIIDSGAVPDPAPLSERLTSKEREWLRLMVSQDMREDYDATAAAFDAMRTALEQ